MWGKKRINEKSHCVLENVASPWFVAVIFPPDRSLPFHTTLTLTCTAARLKRCSAAQVKEERGIVGARLDDCEHF